MAWAKKRASGKWQGLYRDANGTERSAGTFTHKARAERAAGAAEEKARRNVWADLDARKRTWGEWCEQWWDTRTVEPGTQARDLSRRDLHLKPRWGKVPIGAISRQDVMAWCNDLREGGLAASSVEKCKSLLSASMVAAMAEGVIDVNPAARIRLPKPPPAQERYLTSDDVEAIAAELPTLFDRMVVETLANTGLRPGELAGLHRDRVIWDRGVVRIVETWSERNGHVKAYPKGRKIRDVPVPGWLLEQWATLPVIGDSCGLKHRGSKCRGPLLFTSIEGAVLRWSNWSEIWRTAVLDSGVGHVRIYDLRHTYASWLLQGGRSLTEVGKLLGHIDPKTTQIYAWLAETNRDDVLAALPAVRLRSAPGGTVVDLRRKTRSEGVGPVGLEPTTRGLKGRKAGLVEG